MAEITPNHNDLNTQIPEKLLHQELFETIDQEINLSQSYLLLLIFSTVIAVLGLLTDSAAVVIGAMLISPLFWPIIGLSLSIITSRHRLTKRASLNLLTSLFIVLIIGVVLGSLSPIKDITSEIYARTNPTLLDLGIALASSVIGVLAIYHHRISQSATGVAVSIALLPALCVSGIGIAYQSWPIFLGSFLLFATNAAAIVFIGAITFYFLHIRPARKEDETRLRLGLVVSFLVLFMLSIPLSMFLFRAINHNQTSTQIRATLTDEITQIHPQARIEGLDIRFPHLFSRDIVSIRGTVYLPEGSGLTTGQQNSLVNKLADQVNYGVDLNLNLVNSLSLSRDEDEEIRQMRQTIRQEIWGYFSQKELDVNGQNLEVVFEDFEAESVSLLLLLKQSNQTDISYSFMIGLENHLASIFETKFEINLEILPTIQLGQASEIDRFEREVQREIESRLRDHIPLGYVDRVVIDYPDLISQIKLTPSPTATGSAVLGITTANIQVFVYLPEEAVFDSSIAEQIESSLRQTTQTQINLDFNLIYFQSLPPTRDTISE